MLFRSPSLVCSLALRHALPIFVARALGGAESGPAAQLVGARRSARDRRSRALLRSEEHTSELQSPYDLVCRLLLEKKKITVRRRMPYTACKKIISLACYMKQ